MTGVAMLIGALLWPPFYDPFKKAYQYAPNIILAIVGLIFLGAGYLNFRLAPRD